ncbi:MAG TPA: phosphatidate cytidylyltransferase [Flavipsychrobacter sp.]|nr:phosphatidate cytidylyltransferase [Flavipsychrobacter sp.]
MALNWPTFFTRLGSAIVFAVIMMTGLLWNVLAFMILISFIQVLCLREYFRLVKKIHADITWPGWLPFIVQVVSLVWLWLLFDSFYGSASWPLLLWFPAFIILATTLSKKTEWQSGLLSLTGMLYIMLPTMLLLMLRMTSIIIPLALILMLWVNDTMAYLVGSFIGKTPFSEISPKKTWEGTLGGVILTILGAAIWGYFSHYYRMIDWMILSLFVSIAGTAGDLLESKLKRIANVKDSGTMMPGHGGALDRFDSLLIATPFAFCYAYFFMPPLPLVIF